MVRDKKCRGSRGCSDPRYEGMKVLSKQPSMRRSPSKLWYGGWFSNRLQVLTSNTWWCTPTPLVLSLECGTSELAQVKWWQSASLTCFLSYT